MSFDYESLRAETVVPLIAQFGRPLALRRAARATTAAPVAGKPWLSVSEGDASSAVAAQEIEGLTGVFLSLNRTNREGQNVEAKTQGVIVASTEELPEEIGPDWQVVDGTRIWEVVSAKPLKPGPTALMYRLELAL